MAGPPAIKAQSMSNVTNIIVVMLYIIEMKLLAGKGSDIETFTITTCSLIGVQCMYPQVTVAVIARADSQ